MEEAQYNYFNSLMRTSSSNTFFMIVITFLEINPFLLFFIECPIVIRNYVKETNFNMDNNNILNAFKNISFYYQFSKLRNKKSSHYPIYIVLVFLLFLILYIFLFFEIAKINKKYDKRGKSKVHNYFSYFETSLANFYDHFIFRALSIYFFEIIINYLMHSSTYAIQIIMSLLLSFSLFMYIMYLMTNRLCVKFNKDHKYIYDNGYMLYYDFVTLILKIIVCFDNNIVNRNSLHFFLNIFALCILLGINVVFLKTNCINILSCICNWYYNIFLSFVIFGLVFEEGLNHNGYFALYFVSTIFTSTLYIVFLRMYKLYRCIIPSLTNSKDHFINQFQLFCEYYDTNSFEYFFKKLCFANGLIYKKNAMIEIYIKKLTKIFKEECNGYLNIRYTFYYIMSKIYKELMTHTRNSFKLLFKTWEILKKLKRIKNTVYYQNLRFFYQKLCDIYSTKNNSNYLDFCNSYYDIYNHTFTMIESLKQFIKKKGKYTTEDYISISDKLKTYQTIVKEQYKNLSSSPYKDEYQRILLRIIIEGILNKPINKTLSSMLISEEISSNDELFERHFNNCHQILIKLNLHHTESKIIKIGKEFNKYLNNKIEHIFPIHFQHLGLKMLYQSFHIKNETRQYLNTESFNFIIYDAHNNLKSFLYLYRIYPNISNNVTYIDGVYQLGKDELIVTEVKDEKEYLLLTSEQLEKYLLINQSFLNLMWKYNMQLCLDDLYFDSLEKVILSSSIYQHIQALHSSLLNLCTIEDVNALNTLFNHINSIYISKKTKPTLHLLYKNSIHDEEHNREYKCYSISINNSKHNRATRSSFTVHSKREGTVHVESTERALPSFINDNNSVSSNISQVSSHGFSSSIGLKKKKKNKEYKKNNCIIIVCNVIIIILSIVCLTYENSLNNKLKESLMLFKTTFLLNRFILKSLINFFSMFCGLDEEDNSTCYNHYHRYLEEHQFEELYQFGIYEMVVRLETFPKSYQNLKNLIELSNDNTIIDFLNKKVEMHHIVYENGYFNNSYYSNETFDFVMLKYINLLIMITNDITFESTPIYPIYLDENFNPIKVINQDNKADSYNEIQLKVTEILVSYLSYSDNLFELQDLLVEKTNEQHKINQIHLSFFVIALVACNVIVAGIIFFFFRKFYVFIQKQFSLFEQILENHETIENLENKLSLLEDLLKMFYKSPIKLVYKLSKLINVKHANTLHKSISTNKLNEKTEKETPTPIISKKKYKVSFLTNKYINILSLFILFYLIYIAIFYVMYSYSFKDLRKIITVLQTSAYTEEETYLVLGLIQIMEYTSFPISAISKVLPHLISREPSQYNSFEILLNGIQKNYMNEFTAKEEEDSIPNHSQLLTINCDTIYQDTKDSRFAQIFKTYPEMHYEEILITYCKSVPSLQFGERSDKFLTNEIFYRSTKLLLNKENYDEKTQTSYNQNELYDVITELLYILRPLRKFYGDYYFNIVLKDKMDKHYNILLFFLIGNIVIQLIYFSVIKCCILDKIERVLSNFARLNKILKCI